MAPRPPRQSGALVAAQPDAIEAAGLLRARVSIIAPRNDGFALLRGRSCPAALRCECYGRIVTKARAEPHGPNAIATGTFTPFEIVRSTLLLPGAYSVTVLLPPFET
jgi:hypothetical protein